MENRIETNPNFWDCECEHNYIHTKHEKTCGECGAVQDEQPDSIASEVFANGYKQSMG